MAAPAADSLYMLIRFKRWARAHSLLTSGLYVSSDFVNLIYYQYDGGDASKGCTDNPLCLAVRRGAPLSLLTLLIDLAALAHNRYNIVDQPTYNKATQQICTPLASAAAFEADADVLKLLIREHPRALLENSAATWEHMPKQSLLLFSSYNALRDKDYQQLALLVDGDARELQLLTIEHIFFDFCERNKYREAEECLPHWNDAVARRLVLYCDRHGNNAMSISDRMPPRLAEQIMKIANYDSRLTTTTHNKTGHVVSTLICPIIHDLAVIKLMIRANPKALIIPSASTGKTPLQTHLHTCSTQTLRSHRGNSVPAQVETLYVEATVACQRRDYAGLIALCGGTSPTLSHLLKLSCYATTMLCISRFNSLSSLPISTCAVTTAVVALLSRIYDREKGIIREIITYLGPNQLPYEQPSASEISAKKRRLNG